MLTADLFRYFGGVASELKGETIPLGENLLSYSRREPDWGGCRDYPLELTGCPGGSQDRHGHHSR